MMLVRARAVNVLDEPTSIERRRTNSGLLLLTSLFGA
jgi:hypothetical protein